MNVPWSSSEIARLKSEIIAGGGTIEQAVARAQAVRRGTSRSSLDRMCKVHLGKTLARALLDADAANNTGHLTRPKTVAVPGDPATHPKSPTPFDFTLRAPPAPSPVVALETPRPPPPEDDPEVPVDFEELEEPTVQLPPVLHAHEEIQDERELSGYVPHPLRGPTTKPHYVPEGHELGGVSRLTDPKGATLQEWSKTRVAGADKPPVPIPASFLLDRASVMKRGDGSTVVEWASYKHDAVERWEAIKTAITEHIATYVRPAEPVVAPTMTDDDRITLYPIGDPHIGMLAWAEEVGENFDLGMAERELCECLRQLVARSPSTTEAIVANLGDFWHAENDLQRTQRSGNKLDVDGRAGKVARVGLRILRTIIDTALTKHARVRVRSIPGNHDLSTALWAPMYLAAVYEDDPRVVIEDGFAPYQFDVFGANLFGWAHGDGAKIEALAEIMAHDEAEKWGATTFRTWHTGHRHHLETKEFRGCVVETHRTLAGRDAWHNHAGYRSGRSLKAITYHHQYGMDSVAVVGIERVRAALLAKVA